MGRAKAEMMRRQEMYEIARDVAVRAKAIERCERHEEITTDCSDDDANRRAYALGTNMVKAGEVDAERQEFMDAIKAAIDSSGDECPICARDRERD